MRYEIYLDTFWLTNFVMDLLVLTLVRKYKRSRSAFRRIVLSAAFGAAGSVLLFLLLRRYELYQLLIHFFLNPVMILIAFPVKGWHDFWRDFLLTYVLMLLLGGVMGWGMETLGRWEHFWIWAVGGFGIGALALHWLEARKTENFEYEVLLVTKERRLSLNGFLDTGNLLVDPLVNQPVHIIQEKLLQEELLQEKLSVRYIPFHSLGQEQGLLPVVTLNAMYISNKGSKDSRRTQYIEKPVFGLADEKLFQEKNYQVILNAGCIAG